MEFASAITTSTVCMEAVAHLSGQIDAQLGRAPSDLALLFLHPSHHGRADDIARTLRRNLGVRHLIGCSAAGLIGGEQEIENEPAIALWVGRLPQVSLTPLRVKQEEVEEATGPGYWHFQFEVETEPEPSFIFLVDPFSLGSTQFISHLTEAYPGRPIIGALASGGREPGEMQFLLDEEVFTDGAVGIALSGQVELQTVVSSGCRPIGEPLTVTRAERNLLYELAGRPPLVVLQELITNLSPADQALARQALCYGRVINEYQEDYGRGDFLVRNLIGQDPQSGALAVGDLVQAGQLVQFQVRDGKSADEDLRALLQRQQRQGGSKVHGALMFNCLGRGTRMYGIANHDLDLVQATFDHVPTAGFFGNGEIGPVGDRVFVHGFTNVIGLFREPAAVAPADPASASG